MIKTIRSIVCAALALMLAACTLLPIASFAAEDHNVMLTTANGEGDTTELPSSFTLVGTKHLAPISSQGAGSCVSQAVTYMQFTNAISRYMEAYFPDVEWNPASGDEKYIMSPRFTYMLSGPGTAVVLDLLKEQGCLTEADFNFFYKKIGNTYVWEYGNARTHPENYSWPTGEQFRKAFNYRLLNYDQVWVKGSLASGAAFTTTKAGEEMIQRIKTYLNAGNVVMTGGICGGWTYKRIDNNGTGTLGKTGDMALVYNVSGVGGHQVNIVGYDDEITCTIDGVTMKGAFLMANSWDTTWQNDGYVWVMYDALNAKSEFAGINDYIAKKESKERTITFDQFVFIDWRKDVAVGTYPEVSLEIDLTAINRENTAVYLIRSSIDDNGKEVIDTIKPDLFECGDGFGGMHPGIGDKHYPFSFSGIVNPKNAETNTFVLDLAALFTPANGKTVKDYKYGVQVWSKNGEEVKCPVAKIVNADGTVLAQLDNPEIAPSKESKKSTKVWFEDFSAAKVNLPVAEDDSFEIVSESKSTIFASGATYAFSLKAAEGYNTKNAIVSFNGTAVEAADGVYSVVLTGNDEITVTGVEKNEGEKDPVTPDDPAGDEDGEGLSTGAIIGIVAGAVVVIAAVVVAVVCTKKKKAN